MFEKDKFYMTQALEEAKKAYNRGEVPVGAVAVCHERGFIVKAHNRTITQMNPCAHAEILVLQEAALISKNHRLNSITLYTTLEPCAMCAGAIVQARIARLVFATRDWNAGAAGTVMNLLHHPRLNHHTLVDEGIYQQEAKALLNDFFRARRGDKHNPAMPKNN